MLNPFRDNEELALRNVDVARSQLHCEVACDHEEHLVLFRMRVPDEFSLELHEFHVAISDLTDDLWCPMLLNMGQLFE